jgi:hypothetical protein
VLRKSTESLAVVASTVLVGCRHRDEPRMAGISDIRLQACRYPAIQALHYIPVVSLYPSPNTLDRASTDGILELLQRGAALLMARSKLACAGLASDGLV